MLSSEDHNLSSKMSEGFWQGFPPLIWTEVCKEKAASCPFLWLPALNRIEEGGRYGAVSAILRQEGWKPIN